MVGLRDSFSIGEHDQKKKKKKKKGDVPGHRNFYGPVILSMGNNTWDTRIIQRRFDVFDVLLVGKNMSLYD
jgi:hypothetical protein